MLASVLDPLYKPMAWILATIYSVIPNYAVAIFGLTCIVLAILTPLTLKGLRSTIKIQKLMPEQKRLQAEFKDDRQALNAAIMAMYKENKVSPVGGCLPFLVQSPFFIALFGVLQGMTRVKYWVPTGQAMFVDTQATGKMDGKIPEGAVAVGLPKYIPDTSKMYDSLFGTADAAAVRPNLPKLSHNPGEVKAFGFDLARSASEMVSEGFVAFLPYLTLLVLMVGLQVFAQRQVNRRNPAAAAANPQMQTITKVMPFMFGIFGWGFQAGLTLYWTTSSLLRIVQQWALYRFDPTLAESVKEKRADLEREAGSGKRPAKGTKPVEPAPKQGLLARGRALTAGLGAPQGAAGTDAAPSRPGGGKGTKGGGQGAKPAAKGGGKAAANAPAKPAIKPAAKPATKPTKPSLGPAKPATNGSEGGSNGSGGGTPRPNPGRQQPKKRRKGR